MSPRTIAALTVSNVRNGSLLMKLRISDAFMKASTRSSGCNAASASLRFTSSLAANFAMPRLVDSRSAMNLAA